MPSATSLCPKCAGEVRDGWRVCPACAAPLGNGDAETKTIFTESPSVSTIEEGRFPAGTVLAGRYRILGLLGHGGMGEVYRAYDLILNQAVALKFLAGAHMSEAALARFRNEVRIARQVSHPNVCRVYDIGFIEGMHFLSMEYLDGEDLDSLLRRIGRLPQDKAIEFTRKICAGLSAAHDRGVLHRDLKPANIMIDGRGQVRVTDFGLAALAAEIPLSDIRSGTPAYMSPEQKAGKEVTTRSDLYSLGLVLFEMFTGKRRISTQTNPTDLVKDLDPAVERVILRCLEEDPKRRPSSALSVAMALPGGDPIAAALAAGETPSPEMVAASAEKEGLTTRAAVAYFVAALIGLVLGPMLYFKATVLSRAPVEIPADGLAFRAQEMLRQFGYTENPKTTAYGFDNFEPGYLRYLQEHDAGHRVALLASDRPAVIGFWYRQHRDELRADSFFGMAIGYGSPANSEPGMIRLILDAKGRLYALEARPEPWASGKGPTASPDWPALFGAAQLDLARFTPAAPEQIPPMAFDARMAWTGTFAEGRMEQVRVEAASWAGRPVYFNISGDWLPPNAALAGALAPGFLFIVVLVGAGLVAWNNLRLGRGDRRGAANLAAVAFLMVMCAWAAGAAHVASTWELDILVMGLSEAVLVAALLWTLYVATEPYVRRNWPDALISWTRLQAGRVRDPLVASHVLAGISVSAGVGVLISAGRVVASRQSPLLNTLGLNSLDSVDAFISQMLKLAVTGLFLSIGFLLVVAVLRLLVRRMWIADVLGSVLFGVFGLGGAANLYQGILLGLPFAAGVYSWLWLLRRFGLLATVAALVVDFVGFAVPAVFPSWYAGRSLVALAIPIAVTVWALWVILSAQRRPTTDSPT